jgi:hypothetical protein
MKWVNFYRNKYLKNKKIKYKKHKKRKIKECKNFNKLINKDWVLEDKKL